MFSVPPLNTYGMCLSGRVETEDRKPAVCAQHIWQAYARTALGETKTPSPAKGSKALKQGL